MIDFVRCHKDGPFFVYYTSVLKHSPRVETPDPTKPGARWPSGLKSNREYLDHLMGRLRAALKSEGLDEKTLVVFLGDNGTGPLLQAVYDRSGHQDRDVGARDTHAQNVVDGRLCDRNRRASHSPRHEHG